MALELQNAKILDIYRDLLFHLAPKFAKKYCITRTLDVSQSDDGESQKNKCLERKMYDYRLS